MVSSLTQELTSRCDFCTFEIQRVSTCILWHHFKMPCDERLNGGQQHLWQQSCTDHVSGEIHSEMMQGSILFSVIFGKGKRQKLLLILTFNLPLKKKKQTTRTEPILSKFSQKMIYLNKLMRSSLVQRPRAPSREISAREKFWLQKQNPHTTKQNREWETDVLQPPTNTDKPQTKFQQLKPQIFLSGAKTTCMRTVSVDFLKLFPQQG